MGSETHQREALELRKSVVHWLVDSDPAIRWQVFCDLMDETEEVIADERRGLLLTVGVQGSLTFSPPMVNGVAVLMHVLVGFPLLILCGC